MITLVGSFHLDLNARQLSVVKQLCVLCVCVCVCVCFRDLHTLVDSPVVGQRSLAVVQ